MTLESWLLAIMVAASPPDVASARTTHADAQETAADRLDRYRGIAHAVAAVSEDPNTSLPFAGPSAVARSAALVLAVSFFESGWRRDVDLGVGKLARGSGVDSCLLQLRVGSGVTAEGWTHDDLTSDREKCVRAGLAKMRRSLATCRALPVAERLSAYAAGNCDSDRGRADSRKKFAVLDRWIGASPVETVGP